MYFCYAASSFFFPEFEFFHSWLCISYLKDLALAIDCCQLSAYFIGWVSCKMTIQYTMKDVLRWWQENPDKKIAAEIDEVSSISSFCWSGINCSSWFPSFSIDFVTVVSTAPTLKPQIDCCQIFIHVQVPNWKIQECQSSRHNIPFPTLLLTAALYSLFSWGMFSCKLIIVSISKSIFLSLLSFDCQMLIFL